MKLKINIKHPLLAAGKKVINLLKPHASYFVGGAVRDLVLKRQIEDLDIATAAKPNDVENILNHAGIKTKPLGKKFGTILAFADGFPIEITTFRKEGRYSDRRHPDNVVFVEDFKTDALRRDFTINALGYSAVSECVEDPTGLGLADLKRRIIRFVGKATERIDEDSLRMMRAVRFATQLGFKIEKNSYAAIKTRAKYIQKVSGERIREEFDKILISKNREHGIRLLDELGMLRFLIPGIEKSRLMDHDSKTYHLEGSIFEHTLMGLAHSGQMEVLYAMLFHDLGKVHSKTRALNSGVMVNRFFGHQKLSAKMFKDFALKLRFGRKTTRIIEWLVLEHDNRAKFIQMKPEDQIRYVRHPWFPLLLQVWYADSVSNIKILNNGKVGSKPSKAFLVGTKLLQKLNVKSKLVSDLAKGEKIIAYKKTEQGPKIKNILDKIVYMIIANQINNESDLKNFLKNKKSP